MSGESRRFYEGRTSLTWYSGIPTAIPFDSTRIDPLDIAGVVRLEADPVELVQSMLQAISIYGADYPSTPLTALDARIDHLSPVRSN